MVAPLVCCDALFSLLTSFTGTGQCLDFVNAQFSSEIIEVHLESTFERDKEIKQGFYF